MSRNSWSRHFATRLVAVTTVSMLAVACGSDGDGTSEPASDATNDEAPNTDGDTDGDTEAGAPEEEEQAAPPSTIEELALYDGPDRQEILEAGAEEEGALMLYTTAVLEGVTRPALDAFMEKYPFIEAEVFRGDSGEVTSRMAEEYNAGRHDVDVLEMSTGGIKTFSSLGMLVPFYSPEKDAYKDDAVFDDFVVTRQSHYSLGYNTDLIAEEDVPRTFAEYADPKWNGQIGVAGSQGVRWAASAQEHFGGTEELEALAENGIQVQNVSGRAMVDLVVAGEVPLFLHANYAHVQVSRDGGAPVAWVPTEAVYSNNGGISLPSESQNPHAALLYIDFVLSEEGQEIYVSQHYISSREGFAGGPESDYPVLDIDELGGEDPDAAYAGWEEEFNEIFLQ